MSLTELDRADIQADIDRLTEDLRRTLNNLPPPLPGLEQKRADWIEGYKQEIALLEKLLNPVPADRGD